MIQQAKAYFVPVESFEMITMTFSSLQWFHMCHNHICVSMWPLYCATQKPHQSWRTVLLLRVLGCLLYWNIMHLSWGSASHVWKMWTRCSLLHQMVPTQSKSEGLCQLHTFPHPASPSAPSYFLLFSHKCWPDSNLLAYWFPAVVVRLCHCRVEDIENQKC